MTILSNDIQQVLEGAAEQLEQHGWRRGQLGPVEGPNCLVGAIQVSSLRYREGGLRANRLMFTDTLVMGACQQVLAILAPTASITTWNDEVCQSAGQAAELLRQAAKDAANA